MANLMAMKNWLWVAASLVGLWYTWDGSIASCTYAFCAGGFLERELTTRQLLASLPQSSAPDRGEG